MTATAPDSRGWLDQVKAALGGSRVAAGLGLKGRGRRVFCPSCQPNGGKTPDLEVKHRGFRCYKCGAHGGLVDLVMLARGDDFGAAVDWLADQAGMEHPKGGRGGHGARQDARLGRRGDRTPPPSLAPVGPLTAPSVGEPGLALTEVLAVYQEALPDSPGAEYLHWRGIPLELAQAYGAGYAGPGLWAHRDREGRPVRDWPGGRLVFPHTDPWGNVVNLYGRAVGDGDIPKAARHDHLSGPRGYFNAAALGGACDGPLFVTEGAFDALTLIAAGEVRTVAIFGVNGWRWEWARGVADVALAFDADTADPANPSHHAVKALVREALLRGRRVSVLPLEAYGVHKDASEAWIAGGFRLGTLADAEDLAERQAIMFEG